MALENKMKQITSRQKIIIITMVVVVLIIIWQVIGLVGTGSSTPAIAPTAKSNGQMTKESPDQTQAPASAKLPEEPATTLPSGQSALKQGSIVNDPQFNRMQRLTEEKYVGKLNELEELRIQRQIAETNQAIAAAKLATVTAEKDISDLLTKPPSEASYTIPQPAIPSGGSGGEEGSPPPVVPTQEVAPYVLVSVSMLLNKWSAVISLQGTMYTVNVGDTLPPDGSVVAHISKNSVTLRKDGKSRKVGITASI